MENVPDNETEYNVDTEANKKEEDVKACQLNINT